MKSIHPSSRRLGLLTFASALLLGCVLPASAQTAFRVTSTPSNSTGAVLTIDHPLLNGKPKAKPVITQFWSSVYNPHPVGVHYDTTNSRWQIINEDSAALPNNSEFNVLVPRSATTVLASATNSYSNITLLTLNKKKPAARMLVTHHANPVLTLTQTRSNRYHGVWYDYSYDKWAIYAESGENIEAIGFNVVDVTALKFNGAQGSFVHIADATNTLGHTSTIDNAAINGQSGALIFVQHLYGSGVLGTQVNHPIGIYFASGKWRVFTEDVSALPANSSFIIAAYTSSS